MIGGVFPSQVELLYVESRILGNSGHQENQRTKKKKKDFLNKKVVS